MSVLPTIGSWSPDKEQPVFHPLQIISALQRIRETVHLIVEPQSGAVGVGFQGHTQGGGYPLLASLPALYPEWLGDRSFAEAHGVRMPYVAGAMANGIATEEVVIAMANAGFMGFFGAAGLSPERVEKAVIRLKRELDPKGLPWGSNLIHSPNEPHLEQSIVELYIKHDVRRVSAAAYMKLSPSVVQYALHGLTVDQQGHIQRKNHLFAKISRPEVARHFMQPAPQEMLQLLLQQGKLTAAEVELAQHVPIAEDITVESDSGGHTDNQALGSLFPCIMQLRNELQQAHGYTRPIRIGAAGGIGTPQSVASAFGLGAAYVLTGSINQGCVESGLHPSGKKLLANASLADVVMAPAADMFELGVEVQVLKRGTMFGVRAKKLYHLYRAYPSLAAIPAAERTKLEKQILRQTVEQAWEQTRSYWSQRDSREIERAERDPKHQMALVFRAYLGLSSKWAIWGEEERKMDYQIWCGPAMGAFNQWSAGSFLEAPENRQVAQVARNLMEGAAVITRAHQLRSYGVGVPAEGFQYQPRKLG